MVSVAVLKIVDASRQFVMDFFVAYRMIDIESKPDVKVSWSDGIDDLRLLNVEKFCSKPRRFLVLGRGQHRCVHQFLQLQQCNSKIRPIIASATTFLIEHNVLFGINSVNTVVAVAVIIAAASSPFFERQLQFTQYYPLFFHRPSFLGKLISNQINHCQ